MRIGIVCFCFAVLFFEFLLFKKYQKEVYFIQKSKPFQKTLIDNHNFFTTDTNTYHSKKEIN